MCVGRYTLGIAHAEACYHMPMCYLEGLNEQQREAAQHRDGPLLIIAGAGAGKTKTITHRIAHLIEQGIPAHAILAITFTNKAAAEMRERVRALLSENCGTPTISTFHSCGVRLLREFHEEAGLERGFSIWDRDDSIRAIKKALEKLEIAQFPPRAILAALSRHKGDGMRVDEYTARAASFREHTIARVWRLYDQTLREEGALDFDDLLARTLMLLQEKPHVLALVQNRWRYITIDEYQDTNASQFAIARLLAGERRNICVVGDGDQNIYSWRGADMAYVLDFETFFPNAKVITLEQNYRSTRTILAAANAVIAKNVRRREKNLFTNNDTGEPIVLYRASNEIDEAWFVAQMSMSIAAQGTPLSSIAILYRENFQSRVLEEAFLACGVPYRVLGIKFFERKEVKDTLSYLRAALNPKSKSDLTRIIGTPPRGIGKTTLEKMLAGQESSLASALRAKVAAFRDTLARIRRGIDTMPASEAVRLCVEVSGMEAMFTRDTREGAEHLENIHELINLSVRYDDAMPPAGIEMLLEEAALQSDQDELDAAAAHAGVTLMTVHASKGLEFDAVFVTGLEQGLFPSTRESDEPRDSEEERRLFYVAITRARKRLFLSYARERSKYGTREPTIPSEFLSDIDVRLLAEAQPKRSLLDEPTIYY